MNKIKILKFAVVALFLINILTLGFIFTNNSKKSHAKKMPREIIIKKLNFDKNQVKAYDELIKKHKNSIDVLDSKIKEAKNNLYFELSVNENESKADSILISLNHLKSDIEQVHYNHFLDIKKLCKKEQLESYNELTKELAKLFAPNRMSKKDE